MVGRARRPIVPMSRADGREPRAVWSARAATLCPRLRSAQHLGNGAHGAASPQGWTHAGAFTLLETLTALALAAVIIVASALALIPRDIRTIRSSDAAVPAAAEELAAKLEVASH